jgi:superfamily II DNA helicase RecQ
MRVQPRFGSLSYRQKDHAEVDLNEPEMPLKTISLEDRALEAMRAIIKKPDTTWSCPEQRIAVNQVLNLKRDVLAIMRTGSGKSMLMILPTLIEGNSITVGVLPLRSLMSDYERRLTGMGLGYEKYEGGIFLRGASNLILVSADKARTPGWKQALGELHQRKTVVRMVFDEGHFAFTGNDFRTALENVHELRIFPMQMVVLSGTVPPRSEDHVCHAFGLINPFIVRMSTSRPEICYILEPPRVGWQDILERVQKLVETRMPHFDSRDRALVFVPYLNDGEELASALGCAFYSAGGNKEGEQDRQNDYDDWISGEAKIMVCTSAFGAGNDYSHVRLVIHAGSPREMIGYTQESARAGRDGFPAHAIILPKKKGAAPAISPGEIDHKGVLAMYDLLHNSDPTTCLRFAITSFSDPMGTMCTSERRAQMCNRCHEEAHRDPQRRL